MIERIAPKLILTATAIVVLGMGALLSFGVEHHLSSNVRNDALLSLNRMAMQIDRHLTKNLFVAYALAALVKQGGGDIQNFAKVAEEFIAQHPGISALQLAPGGVIRQSIPLAGNEKAIGHDLLADKSRATEAHLAVQTRTLTLAGPFELIQGGKAIIGRLPVFMEDQPEMFWGFTTVLIRMPDLLGIIGLDTLEKEGYSYELWRAHPDTGGRQVLAKSQGSLTEKPITAPISVPNGRWFLSLAPQTGWDDSQRIALEICLTLIICIATCWGLHIHLTDQQSLARSEARYRTLYHSTPAMMHSINEHGEIVSVSEQWLNTLGYPRNEVIGHKSAEFLTEASRRYAVETVLPEFFRLGSCIDIPYQMTAKDGRVLDVLLSATSERDTDGRIIRSLAVIRDVTKLIRTERRLHDSQSLMRSILDSLTSSVVVIDESGAIILVNRAWRDFAARNNASEQVENGIGINYFAVCKKALPNPDVQRMLAGMQDVLAGLRNEFVGEYDCHSKDERRWFLMHAVPMSGSRKGLAISHVNITAQRLANEERLAWAISQRDALVREVHHRIKNNLQSVASLLRRELGSFPEFDSRLNHALDQLHAISTVHGLQGRAPNENIQLDTVLRQICENQRNQTGFTLEPAIDMHENAAISATVAKDEAVAIALIVNELISNACKHAPVHAESPSIKLVVQEATATIYICNRTGGTPPSFDFCNNTGLGTGLRLIKALLPLQGAKLVFTYANEALTAELRLTSPVVFS